MFLGVRLYARERLRVQAMFLYLYRYPHRSNLCERLRALGGREDDGSNGNCGNGQGFREEGVMVG